MVTGQVSGWSLIRGLHYTKMVKTQSVPHKYGLLNGRSLREVSLQAAFCSPTATDGSRMLTQRGRNVTLRYHNVS
jgi:hypothetical protein